MGVGSSFIQAASPLTEGAILTDLRYSLRSIRARVGFSLGVVLTLGAALGLGTAVLVALELVVLRPWPFPDPEALIYITTRERTGGNDARPVSGPELFAWVQGTTTLEAIGGAEMPPRRSAIVRTWVRSVFAMSVAALLVVIIAAANIVSLTRTAVDGRRRELATRLALGAGRWRILRLVVTEVGICFVVGWGLAWLVSVWLLSVAATILPSDIPQLLHLSTAIGAIGTRSAVLAVVMLASVATAVFAHTNVRSSALTDFLRSGHYRAGAHTHHTALVAQIAPAMALTVVAILAGKTLWELQKRNYGFTPNQLTAAQPTRT